MSTKAFSGTPKISVIIPCYNRSATILKTLESALAQTYPAHEIIVIDDGSTDNTAETILLNYTSDQVKYIYQDNSGSASARNTGIKYSQGDWLAFLDSDDEWTDDKLLDDIKSIKSNSDIDFVHGNRLHKYPSGNVDMGRRHKPTSDFCSKKYLLSAWCIKTSTVLIKRSLLNSLEAYFEPELKTCQDYELFWRAVLSARRISYIESPNVIINITKDGASRTQPGLNIIKDNITAMDSALKWAVQIDAAQEHKFILERRKHLERLQLLRKSISTKDFWLFLNNLWQTKYSIFYLIFNYLNRRKN